MDILGSGRGIGAHSVRGKVRLLPSRKVFDTVKSGEIVVLERPDTELILCLSRVAGIICRSGGVGAHLAVIALEAEIPYLILHEELRPLETGMEIVLDPTAGHLLG